MSTVPKIESNDLSLEDVYKDFYTVPDFQREYIWEREHAEKLLEDVFDVFYDEECRIIEGPEYFIGSIVVCRDTGGVFQLIDGQQRITTIYLILCAIRDCLEQADVDPPSALKGQIADTVLDPQTGNDIFRYRVELQYEDSEGVLEKIAVGEEHADSIRESTASVRNILTAYRAIREFLSVNFANDPARIKQFLAALTFRVKLIRIVTPSITNALKVFETINDRGVGLDAMDLLKNLLFMKTPSEDYPKLKQRWKVLTDTLDTCREKPLRFLRYYIMSHYEIDWRTGLREDEIYEWFLDHADESGINAEPMAFVERLVEMGEVYANFIEGKDSHGKPNPYLSNIAALSGVARQHFVLLLAGQHLPPEPFTELCHQLENLFFCYAITREPTKTFERNFARWSKDLRAVKDAEGLKLFVDRYFKPDLIARSDDFDFAFRELTESRIQQYRMRYVLAKITQFIQQQAWGKPADAQLDQYIHKSVHIEHILPRTPTEEVWQAFDKPLEYESYVEKLGNLTLLEKTINTSISNGSYEEKSRGYRQSTFLLTKSLVEKPQVGADTQLNRAVQDLMQFDTWDSQAIEQRQGMLAKLARRVWEMPESTNVTQGV